MPSIRLYYFTSALYGLDAIKHRRVKVARILELNDPFEFVGVELTTRERRIAMERTLADLHADKGLLCMSRNWRNPVQWAHYGDKHRGLCLGFDVTGAEQVRYVSSRASWPDNVDENFMKYLLFTKFSHWSYEDEYRIFAQLNDKIGDHYFTDFGDSIKLAQVIVGCRSTISREQISDALGDMHIYVESFKARTAFRSFSIRENENPALWK